MPRVPGLPGVERALTLRTLDDALRLKPQLTPRRRVVLVGGGWIGLEVAAAAAEAGCQVTVLEVAALPLGTVLGPEIAASLVALHRSHGVEIRTEVTVTGIEDDGVRLGDELVAADVVLVSVGAVPDTALAEAAGLATGNGIVVDEHLRTSAPRVYAAGDVAMATSTRFGPLRVEHWDNAIRQGQLAAKSMLGRDDVYDWAPYFFTDQFEFSMEYVGHSAPTDRVVVKGDLDAREYVAYWLGGESGTIVTAAMNVNIWDVNDRLREIVGTQVDPDQLPDLREGQG
jgi:3-phenylpropionate/trans-cinnamate dioxygenase ferredoxin reductase subunit